MTSGDLVANMLASVRALLGQEPRFANMPRYQLDLHLADLERDLRPGFDDLDAQTDRMIEDEIRWARDEWSKKDGRQQRRPSSVPLWAQCTRRASHRRGASQWDEGKRARKRRQTHGHLRVCR
jgi:hypothetical protein